MKLNPKLNIFSQFFSFYFSPFLLCFPLSLIPAFLYSMQISISEPKQPPNTLLEHQLSILRNKLQQRGNLIRNLMLQIQSQRRTTINIIQQFGQHQRNIVNRLRKLEEINIKYIKDYLLVRKQLEVEQFSKSQMRSTAQPDEYFRDKYEQVRKQLALKVKKYQANEEEKRSEASIFINNCTSLLRQFLLQRQPKYEKIISELTQQRKARLKQVKGLDQFRKNKEQDKFIQSIKEKTKQLSTHLKQLDSHNIVEVFNTRKQIETSIAKLKPELAELDLEDSESQRKMLEKVIEEVVMLNVEPGSVEEKVSEQFLNQEFNSFQSTLKSKTKDHGGDDILNSSLKNLQNASQLPQYAKQAILQRKSYRELIITNKPQTVTIRNVTYLQEPSRREFQKYSRKSQSYIGEDEFGEDQYEVLQVEEDRPLSIEGSEMEEEVQVEVPKEKIKSKETSNKVNSAFQTVMTKSYFQEQQKARDELITQQTSQIQQHEKVIDKLITFIKKEFKEKKMQDIDGDDPEQLMSYYFRVNQKKYVDIKTEMKELESQKKSIEREVNTLKEENQQLERMKESMKVENENLREIEEKLEKQNQVIKQERLHIQHEKVKIKEQKRQIEELLQQEKEKILVVYAQNENLKIKLQLQKLQILALSEIYQNLKSNTKQFHVISNRTENIVKLSLQVLFSTCLSKLTPEQLIARLEKIIELIKINMKVKRDLTFELGIEGYLDHQQNRVKKNFTLKVNEELLPLASNQSVKIKRKASVGCEQISEKKGRILDERKDKSDSKSFSNQLEDLAYEIIEKSLRGQQQKNMIHYELQLPLKSQVREEKEVPMFGNTMGIPEDLAQLLASMVNTIKGKEEEEPQENIKQSQKSKSQDQKGQKGFDQNFIEKALETIRQMKQSKINEDYDLKEMYQKYKQALSCLQRAENLNKQNQMKYQQFLTDLKSKGAKNSPQALMDKLFYMQRVIATQNELLQNQRKQFEETIVKQVQKSQKLAEDVVRSIQLRRSNTKR